MANIPAILLNPAIISIFLLCFLCLKKVNVLLAIIISTLILGVLSGLDINNVMNVFISGMGDNSETALSYILLGTFAATMVHSGVTNVLSQKIIKLVNGKKFLLYIIILLVAIASQNIIPIHIAFIPIIIPPLLNLMNVLNIDRRSIACILAFGLKAPYICIPVGFGLIFQNLIADNLVQNGVNILRHDVWKLTFILGIAMFVGLFVSLFITYSKPRVYKDIAYNVESIDNCSCSKYSLCVVLIAAISTFVVQLYTNSLPLGALVGLGMIFTLKVVPKSKMDKMMNEGIYLMGYVAFVMLVAAGYASVIKYTGSIDALINFILPVLPENIYIIAFIILVLGLFITIGIGSSFGTIPILAVLFIPICLNAGFNTSQIVVLIAAAAALGDAGSPASDTTLGPTAGLNVDGQHNHIYDTCVPTFLHYNIPLILFALLGIYLLK